MKKAPLIGDFHGFPIFLIAMFEQRKVSPRPGWFPVSLDGDLGSWARQSQSSWRKILQHWGEVPSVCPVGTQCALGWWGSMALGVSMALLGSCFLMLCFSFVLWHGGMVGWASCFFSRLGFEEIRANYFSPEGLRKSNWAAAVRAWNILERPSNVPFRSDWEWKKNYPHIFGSMHSGGTTWERKVGSHQLVQNSTTSKQAPQRQRPFWSRNHTRPRARPKLDLVSSYVFFYLLRAHTPKARIRWTIVSPKWSKQSWAPWMARATGRSCPSSTSPKP